jgi:hypothetical protein
LPKETRFNLLEFLMQGLSISAMVVMVMLVGVQSSLAMSRVSAIRADQRFAAMKWDLRRVAEQQVLYYLDEEAFADSPSELRVEGTDGVVLSLTASASGWTGVASHDALGEGHGCAIFFGPVTAPTDPVRPVTAGEVACTD